MTTRSYSDLSDSATTFDPEEQLDRDIDERMKGMTKEEAVAKAICKSRFINGGNEDDDGWNSAPDSLKNEYLETARAAIAAADKWDAEEGNGAKASSSNAALEQIASVCSDNMDIACNHRMALDFVRKIASKSNISSGLDSTIQEELDHPPASIMEEGK